jgi:hypothetical protein
MALKHARSRCVPIVCQTWKAPAEQGRRQSKSGPLLRADASLRAPDNRAGSRSERRCWHRQIAKTSEFALAGRQNSGCSVLMSKASSNTFTDTLFPEKSSLAHSP